MIRIYPGEQFTQLQIEKPLTYKYAVSNHGRLISYTNEFEDGREIKPAKIGGYPSFTVRWRDENKKMKYKTIYLYRVIADAFLPRTSEEQTFVIHLDYKKDNDHHTNLKWVTRDEMLAHAHKSPMNLTRKERMSGPTMSKLTTTQVIRLKKRLADPNRKTRVKMLAKEFGISEMQVYRIKSGENWGHIKV